MRVKEEITLYISDKIITVVNDGVQFYKDWKNESRVALRDSLEELLADGETNGFMPYANFESSITWVVRPPSSKL